MSDETPGSGAPSGGSPADEPTRESATGPAHESAAAAPGADDAPTVDEGTPAGSPHGTTPVEGHARGRVRYQDPETTTPREPTVAEQRARREAEKRRVAQDAAAAEAEERRTKKRKRLLIGGGVAVGLVAVIAIAYAASSDDDDAVDAQCTDQNGVVVADSYCSGNSVGGYYHGGFMPIFLGGFGNQYHYNYGSRSPIGTIAQGGTTTPPASGTSIRSGTSGSRIGSTDSSGSVSRGGLGVSSSSGSSGKGSSGSSSSS